MISGRSCTLQLEIVGHGIRNNIDVALDQFENVFTYLKPIPRHGL